MNNTVLTDEQINEIDPDGLREGFARAIEQAVLQSPEVLELRQRVEDMEKIVAECRDAMTIPNVGSKAEILWPDAMSDAAAVPDFIKASIESMKKDAERYRRVRRGQQWSIIDGIGCELRAETLDAAIDAAMEKKL